MEWLDLWKIQVKYEVLLVQGTSTPTIRYLFNYIVPAVLSAFCLLHSFNAPLEVASLLFLGKRAASAAAVAVATVAATATTTN